LHLTELRSMVMVKDKDKTAKTAVEYEKPEIKDYGDLRELTATGGGGAHFDIPKGSPGPFS
jgi:hypothetical protein